MNTIKEGNTTWHVYPDGSDIIYESEEACRVLVGGFDDLMEESEAVFVKNNPKNWTYGRADVRDVADNSLPHYAAIHFDKSQLMQTA